MTDDRLRVLAHDHRHAGRIETAEALDELRTARADLAELKQVGADRLALFNDIDTVGAKIRAVEAENSTLRARLDAADALAAATEELMTAFVNLRGAVGQPGNPSAPWYAAYAALTAYRNSGGGEE